MTSDNEPRTPGRVVGAIVTGALILVGAPSASLAWGRAAHQIVHTHAIGALPNELKDFYHAHRLEMPSLSIDAGAMEEGPERRFTADRFGPYPFRDLPRTEEALKARFGATAADAGRLPWLIEESYTRLVAAFRSGDKVTILKESDLLAGLITDLHNPLALTENFDGQRSDQPGLWARFSLRLPEVYERHFSIDADVAHLIDDPNAYVFSLLRATYVWADNVAYEEDLAARGRPLSSELYYESLRERMASIVKPLWGSAARAVASFWYTAWVNAGRPALPRD